MAFDRIDGFEYPILNLEQSSWRTVPSGSWQFEEPDQIRTLCAVDRNDTRCSRDYYPVLHNAAWRSEQNGWDFDKGWLWDMARHQRWICGRRGTSPAEKEPRSCLESNPSGR